LRVCSSWTRSRCWGEARDGRRCNDKRRCARRGGFNGKEGWGWQWWGRCGWGMLRPMSLNKEVDRDCRLASMPMHDFKRPRWWWHRRRPGSAVGSCAAAEAKCAIDDTIVIPAITQTKLFLPRFQIGSREEGGEGRGRRTHEQFVLCLQRCICYLNSSYK
jgi:hypothetical protein